MWVSKASNLGRCSGSRQSCTEVECSPCLRGDVGELLLGRIHHVEPDERRVAWLRRRSGPSWPADPARRGGGSEPVVDVHHRDAGRAGVEHAEQRREPAERRAVSHARRHGDHRHRHQPADDARQRALHPRDHDHDPGRAGAARPRPAGGAARPPRRRSAAPPSGRTPRRTTAASSATGRSLVPAETTRIVSVMGAAGPLVAAGSRRSGPAGSTRSGESGSGARAGLGLAGSACRERNPSPPPAARRWRPPAPRSSPRRRRPRAAPDGARGDDRCARTARSSKGRWRSRSSAARGRGGRRRPRRAGPRAARLSRHLGDRLEILAGRSPPPRRSTRSGRGAGAARSRRAGPACTSPRCLRNSITVLRVSPCSRSASRACSSATLKRSIGVRRPPARRARRATPARPGRATDCRTPRAPP